jgi:hypothetical protein
MLVSSGRFEQEETEETEGRRRNRGKNLTWDI